MKVTCSRTADVRWLCPRNWEVVAWANLPHAMWKLLVIVKRAFCLFYFMFLHILWHSPRFWGLLKKFKITFISLKSLDKRSCCRRNHFKKNTNPKAHQNTLENYIKLSRDKNAEKINLKKIWSCRVEISCEMEYKKVENLAWQMWEHLLSWWLERHEWCF